MPFLDPKRFQNLCLKKEAKRNTTTPVEITMHTEEDDKMEDKDSSVKSDLSAEGQYCSDVTSDSLLSFH